MGDVEALEVEWVALILEAKELGISQQEIHEFLQKGQLQNT